MSRTSKRDRKYRQQQKQMHKEHPYFFDEWGWLDRYEWRED